MSQAPGAGEQVRRGWRVKVAESMGPQRVTIPDLAGGSERASEMNIRRRGLELGSIATATIPGASPDQIVAQSPPANATNVSAPKISLLLAAPEERNSFVMPDLAGRSEDDAVNAIVGAGLKVGRIASQAAPAEGDSDECCSLGNSHGGANVSRRRSTSVGWAGDRVGSDKVAAIPAIRCYKDHLELNDRAGLLLGTKNRDRREARGE